jgi:hypothetical protein
MNPPSNRKDGLATLMGITHLSRHAHHARDGAPETNRVLRFDPDGSCARGSGRRSAASNRAEGEAHIVQMTSESASMSMSEVRKTRDAAAGNAKGYAAESSFGHRRRRRDHAQGRGD